MTSISNRLDALIFGAPTGRAREIGLTILRVAVGAIFIAHGAQKFFLLGIPAVAGGFAQGGIPMASFMAPLIASVELLGGIALVAGLLTRVAALGTAFVMLGAMSLVHMKGGFFLPAGIEYTVVLLSASVALILTGPGRFSLDARLGRRVAAREPAAGRRLSSRRAA
jgi:putative oxidoreductase